MDNCPVILLSDVVVFPNIVFSVMIEADVSISAIEYAMEKSINVILSTKQSNFENEFSLNKSSFSVYGVLAKILQVLKMPNGKLKVLFESLKRVRLVETEFKGSFHVADYIILDDIVESKSRVEALRRALVSAVVEYGELTDNIKKNVLEKVVATEDASNLADILLDNLTFPIDDKLKMLGTVDVASRLSYVLDYINREIIISSEEKNIQNSLQEQIEKNNREYYLREQLKAIHKELGLDGAEDGGKSEIEELERRGKLKKFTPEAKEKFSSEIKKLKMMPPMSSETSVIRGYIDWLLELPWGEKSAETNDIIKAKKILDRDHFGLEKVKERILEFLAVQSRVKNVKGQIICLFGPPGVGKTSLAKSIAEATGRNYVKISLGGVRDEAEIRGHRRTYISAFPGKIISALKRAKTSNALILLDEIDKVGADSRGDPESALLEVLDPEQNKMFSDHYLEIDYDLSDVMFVATTNSLEMSRPLLDRLEIIKLSGYTEFEKFEIARKYLIQKVMSENGLGEDEFSVSDDVIRRLIRDYTREAGVRNLEREILNLARKSVKRILENEDVKTVSIDSDNLEEYAGIQKYMRDSLDEYSLIGVTNGLAWTEVGGETLSIEAVSFPGKGKVTLTGKLGDVMQESIQAALSLIRSKSEQFGLQSDFFEKNDFHIHVPDGATPKDGPSAGIAMVTSIVSVVTNRPVRKDVAMTGEITLRGRVFPIGGLKEKLLAAHRAQIKTVLIPKDNEKDLKEIPGNVLKDLEVIPVSHIDEVLKIALV